MNAAAVVQSLPEPLGRVAGAAAALRANLPVRPPAARRSPAGQRPSAAPIRRSCECGGGQCGSPEPTAIRPATASPARPPRAARPSAVPPTVAGLLRRPGQPFTEAATPEIRARLGGDFRSVTVHEGPEADSAARAIGARAFSAGQTIVLGEGARRGERERLSLLAHELTHVEQSKGVPQTGPFVLGLPDTPEERAADRRAEAAVRPGPGGPASPVSAARAAADGSAPNLAAQQVRRKPGPPATETSQPDPGLEQEKATADSTYNKVTGAWSFLAQLQVQAIDSVYTEAKKPSKPSLSEQLLGALAEAALAAALGGIGGLIAGAIEKKVTEIFINRALKAGAGRFRDAAGRFITNEAGIKLAADASKRTAKFAAEAAKDAMKTGVGVLVKPKIHAALAEGKEPIDAFFEGQKRTAVLLGKLGHDDAEDKRALVLSDPNPSQTAQAELEAMNEIFDAAEATQKDETLKNWLIYQARLDASVVGPGRTGEGTTNLSGEKWPGTFGSYDAGVLYVTVRDLRIKKAHLKGSTANFVALLEDKPVNKMGIPVIMEFDLPGVSYFYVNVNEQGFLWLVPSDGGQGNIFLRMYGGATQGMRADESGYGVTTWDGGDPYEGGRYLWDHIVGPQKVKGILEADK